MYVIAHRGASKLVEYENTIEAFQKAIDLGCYMIEFDVRRSRDGVLITYHDDSIDGRLLKDLSYEEIQKIAQTKGYAVPRFVDVLEMSRGKIFLDIELKEGGYEKQVVNVLKEILSYDDYIIKSFLDEVITKVKDIDYNIKTGLLLGKSRENSSNLIKTRMSELFPYKRIRASRCDFISPNEQLIKFGFIKRMKKVDMPVLVWTVNERITMRKLLNKGINGLITDWPNIGLEEVESFSRNKK